MCQTIFMIIIVLHHLLSVHWKVSLSKAGFLWKPKSIKTFLFYFQAVLRRFTQLTSLTIRAKIDYQEYRLMKDRKSHHIESHSLDKTARWSSARYNMQAYDVCHVERRVFDPSSRARRSIMSVKTERDTALCWLTNDVTTVPCDVPDRTSIFTCWFWESP